MRLAALLGLAWLAQMSAPAAPVTWGAATTDSAGTDVFTNGTALYAYAGTATSLNGVSFTAVSSGTTWGSVSFSGLGSYGANTFGYAGSPFSTLSTAYSNVLSGGAYGGTAAVTATLNGLTPGHDYAVQVWLDDSRNNASTETRTATLGSTNGNSVTVAYNAAQTAGGVGQYAVGTFMADGTASQIFTLTPGGTSPSAQINAISVRDLGSSSRVWLGATGSSLWGAASNWLAGIVPLSGDSVVFNSASASNNLAMMLDTSYIIGSLTVSNTAAPVAIGSDGYTLTNSSGINLLGAGQSLTINDALVLSAGQTWNATNSGDVLAVNGGVSGSAALTLSGAGAVVFGGTATYSGNTTINGGSLTLTGGGSIASSGASINLLAGGSLTNETSLTCASINVPAGCSVADNGYLSCASIYLTGGSLTLNGSGSIANANTLISLASGGSLIDGGSIASTNFNVGAGCILALTGGGGFSGNPSLTLAGGATFDVSAVSSAFYLNYGRLTNSSVGAVINGTNDCSSGTLVLLTDGVNPAFIQTNGTMTLSSGTTIVVNNTGAVYPTGAHTLIAAATSGNIGQVTGSLPAVTVTGSGTVAGATGVSLQFDIAGDLQLVVAQPDVWTGTADNTWTNSPNWLAGTVPGAGDAILFNNASTANLTTVLDQDFYVSAVTVVNPSGAVTISGANSLWVYGSGINLAGASQDLTVSAPVLMQADQIWNVTNTHTLNIIGGVSGSANLTVAGSGNGKVVLNSVASHAGNTTVASGTLLVNTPATYTGATTMNSGGTLRAGAANVLPSGAGFGDIYANGTFDLNGSVQTINGLNGNGVVDNTASSAATLIVGANNDGGTYSGVIRNTGNPLALLKTGTGTLYFSGASTNTYSGGFTMTNGGVWAYNKNCFGTGPVTASLGTPPYLFSQVELGGINVTITNALTMDGGEFRVGGGNNNTFNWGGPITVTTNGFSMETDGGAGAVTVSGSISLPSQGCTVISQSAGTQNNTLSGAIVSGGLLTVSNMSGSLVMSGASTWSGGTFLPKGNITPASGSCFGTGPVTVEAGVNIYALQSLNISNASLVLDGGTLHVGGSGSHQLTWSGPVSVTTNNGYIYADGGTGYNGSGYDYGAAIFVNGSVNVGSTSNLLTCSGGNYGIVLNGSLSGASGTIEDNSQQLWLTAATNTFAGTIRSVGGTATVIFYSANSVNAVTVDMNAADSGAFTFASPCTIGGLTGTRNLAITGTLSVGYNNTTTAYGGVLSGAGSLTKTGSGTFTLANAETYTGATTVNGGALVLSGSGALASTNITVAGPATLNVSGATTTLVLGSTSTLSNSVVGAVINGTNNCSAATLSLVFDGVNPSFIQTNGGMTLSGSTVVKINNLGAPLFGGTYRIIAASAAGNSGKVYGTVPTTLTVAGNGALGTASLQIDGSGNLNLVVGGGVPVWTGTSSTSWNTGGNWLTGVIPAAGSNAVFASSSTANLATVLNANFNLATLYVVNPTGPVSIAAGGANTLTLSNGINMSFASQPLNITAPVGVGAAQTWTVTNASGGLTVSNLSGSAALSVAGGGTVTLGGTNTTTGGISITGGSTVKFAGPSSSSFPPSGTIYVQNNGSAGTIDMGGSIQTAPAYVSFPYNSTTTLTNGTLTDNAAAAGVPNANEDYNFMGTINLATNANYISNRRFVIGYHYNGFTTTINGTGTNGSLTWGGDNSANMNYVGVAASESATMNINGGTVNFNNASYGTGNGYLNVGANASVTGTVNVNGANLNVGTWLKLDGYYNSTVGYTAVGNLTVTNGTVTIGGGSDPANNGVLFMDGGNGDNTANTGTSTLTLNNGATLKVAQIQGGNVGTRTINLNGGTIAASLNASNVFLISTNMNVALQSGGGTINSGTNSILIGSVLGNVGGLTKTGVGTLTLTNKNTYSGTTTISGGTLLANNPAGSGTGTSAVTVNSGGTLGGTGTIAGLVTNNAGGILAPGVAGGGRLTLNGNLTLLSGSTNTFAVNGTTPANSSIGAGAAVTYGGVLNIVTNGTFTVGQTFTLFSGTGATNASNFATIAGNPGAGKLFSFTNGILSVVSAVLPAAVINNVTVSGGNLILQGTNGAASGTYSILTSTNLTLPLASWTTNKTGTFTSGGAFSNGIPVGSAGQSFFLIKQP